MRALEEERLATVPDFLVEDVRLDAAAARLAGFAALRAFEAVLRDEDFTALRLALRAAVFLAAGRAEAFFAAGRAEVFFAAVFLAGAFLAAVFLAEDFTADLAAVFLAGAFFAAVFFAEDFTADLAAVFLAGAFFAAVLVPAFLAGAFEDFVADLAADLAATFFVAVFLAPDLAEDLVPFAALEELRRALLFLAVFFLVLVAPVSPVNNMVSGLDLSSVGIAASFKGLRVQPSRFEGNVVIPSGFRLTESVESRIRTFSVDTSRRSPACTCRIRGRKQARNEARRL